MEPQVYEQFNELEKQHWWFCGRRKYLDRILKNLSFTENENLDFCEVGSGTGGNLPMLCRYATVDAVEMNASARTIIKEKKIPGVQHVLPGYLPHNISLEKTYHAIFSLDVIEHVNDDHAGLVELKKYIRNDGWLVTTVPAYQWLWSEHDEANHHKRRYTKGAYCKLLESAGYDVIYASYFNTLLFPLAAVNRISSQFRSKRKNRDYAELKLPGKFINFIFTILFGFESNWAGKIRMPFGLSIVVVAKIK